MKLDGLDRALRALGPYLGDLVVCGAWAWYLYRRCLGPNRWILGEFTRDLDCVGRERLPVREVAIVDRLEEAGFVWVPRGDLTPPVAHFVWPDVDRAEVEIEFLVPARGDGSLRVVEIQQSLTAQPLRDLDILLDEPLPITIDDHSPLASELDFRGTVFVPSLGRFVVQKALIHSRRNPQDQVKDFFYIFDLVDAENGLADAVLTDVLSAKTRWGNEVDEFVALVERRAQEPRFLQALSEQLPPERRPSVAYIEREIAGWLARLNESR